MQYTTSQKERALSRAAGPRGVQACAAGAGDAVKRAVPKSAIAMSRPRHGRRYCWAHARAQPGQHGDDDKSINSAAGCSRQHHGHKDSGGVVAGELGPGKKSGRGGGSSSSVNRLGGSNKA